MTFNIQLTVEEYIQAASLHIMPRPFLKWIGICLLLSATGIGIVSFCFAIAGRNDFIPSILIFVGLAYYGIVFLYLRPRRLRKNFESDKLRKTVCMVEITDETILLKSEIGDAKLPWNSFLKWKENSNLFNVYFADMQYYIFPKRCFASPEQIVEFRQLLEKHLGPAKV